MADKIKEFFSRKLIDAKFKKAGSGKKLNEMSEKVPNLPNSEPTTRTNPSEEARKAGLAALSRFESCSSTSDTSSLPLRLKKSMRKEIEEAGDAPTKPVTKIESSNDVVSKVPETLQIFFRCPFIGPEILPKDEWMSKISMYINELLLTDKNPSYIALLIKSVNHPRKADFACEKLKTCLKNLLDYPGEGKYKKIKVNNALFKEKLLPIDGCECCLISAGFEYRTLEDIEYLVYPLDEPDTSKLTEFIEALDSTEPLELTLDRNVKVFQSSRKFDVNNEPEGFFQLSAGELKFESARRKEQIEDMQVLKTKAMREKEIIRPVFEYTNIRIKFPDGVYLQGTFSVHECIDDVRQFVLEYLKQKSESFTLCVGLGQYVDKSKSLFEEKLAPAALLYFQWCKDVNAEENGYLMDDVLALVPCE